MAELLRVKDYKSIYIIDTAQKELDKLYKKSHGDTIKYQKFLSDCLAKLDETEHIDDLIECMPRVVESLHRDKYGYTLYSIRNTKIAGNPRMLFTVEYDDEGMQTFLLLAFKEQNKSDYRLGIDNAFDRLRSVL